MCVKENTKRRSFTCCLAFHSYISIYIYGVHCGKVLILENIPGHKKIIKCSHRKIFMLNILKISHVYPHYSGWK